MCDDFDRERRLQERLVSFPPEQVCAVWPGYSKNDYYDVDVAFFFFCAREETIMQGVGTRNSPAANMRIPHSFFEHQ